MDPNLINTTVAIVSGCITILSTVASLFKNIRSLLGRGILMVILLGIMSFVIFIVFIVFKPVNVVASNTSIPLLKSSYSGTGVCTSGCIESYNMVLTVNSQDQQGNLRATTQYPDTYYSNYSCTGSIKINSSITLVCQAGRDIFEFSGTLYPDGHIEGTETDGSTIRHLVLR